MQLLPVNWDLVSVGKRELRLKSIGEKLYKAKVYLETPDLFAWTIVIIAVSVGFEKIFMFALRRSVGE